MPIRKAPNAIKILHNNPGKRPLPEGEPRSVPGRPVCPDWLDATARDKWGEVVPILERMGVLTLADGDAVAAYCVAWSELEAATAILHAEGRTCTRGTGGQAPHPAVAMQRSALQSLLAYSAVLGLDPASRSRMHVQPAAEDDPLAAFLEDA